MDNDDKTLRSPPTTLASITGGYRVATPTLSVRIAKFAKAGVDDVLTGRFPDPRYCPHCGQVREESVR